MKDMTGMWILTENALILIVLQLAQIKRMQIKKYFINSKKNPWKYINKLINGNELKASKLFWGKGENSNSGLFIQEKRSSWYHVTDLNVCHVLINTKIKIIIHCDSS